jgi:hypothetical protein
MNECRDARYASLVDLVKTRTETALQTKSPACAATNQSEFRMGIARGALGQCGIAQILRFITKIDEWHQPRTRRRSEFIASPEAMRLSSFECKTQSEFRWATLRKTREVNSVAFLPTAGNFRTFKYV